MQSTAIKRIARIAAVLVLGVAALTVTACASSADAEDTSSKVWGYVASAKNARLDMEENQQGVNELVVKSVTVPGDAWIVVHADDNGKPGMRVGLAHVSKGESVDVKVALKKLTTPKVIVAVHADRGTKNKFDFDMMNKEMSPDRPYFVDEKELAKVATVREFGVKAEPGAAAIEVSDQAGAKESISIDRALAPTDAWVVVHLEKDGGPGQRVGLVRIPAGESRLVKVALDPVPLTENLFVAVHADRGAPNAFEFDMMDKINSADQPFFVDGKEVAVKVRVQ